MFQQILFAIDNSRETSHAMGLVTDLAQRYQSSLVLLSVLDTTHIAPDQLEPTRARIQDFLRQTEQGLLQMGMAQVKTEYREGNVPFVICDVADELGMELIVMGSRGTVSQEQDHSVSNRVINLSPCPVLVVP